MPADPRTPTTIDPGPGNTITDAGEPDRGTVVVRDGEVIYTPEPGYVGPVEIPVTITDRQGGATKTVITLNVGQEQKSRVALPDELSLGRNVVLTGPAVTNARQRATLDVACAPRMRVGKLGAFAMCSTSREGGKTVLFIEEPGTVTLTLSAPQKGRFGALEESRTYTVR